MNVYEKAVIRKRVQMFYMLTSDYPKFDRIFYIKNFMWIENKPIEAKKDYHVRVYQKK